MDSFFMLFVCGCLVFWVTFPIHMAINVAQRVDRPAIPAVFAGLFNVVGFYGAAGIVLVIRGLAGG